MIPKEDIAEWFRDLQDRICQSLEAADGKVKFMQDEWSREEGGGGLSRIIQNGNVIEKGGVNFSAVHGKLSDNIVSQILPSSGPKKPAADFFATGVSIVIHPQNPMVPVIHMNVRYFELENNVKWFGGGIDLTPHYVDEPDAKYFHKVLKEVCDKFHPSYYPEFKMQADDYFFITHRNEMRGIGGIFFDRLMQTNEFKLDDRWNFVKAVGNSFAPLYTYYMNKNNLLPYGEKEKQWQLLRRGRYAEFNLVYDKGTKFGLETNGRTESILMSLPPAVQWLYNFSPENNSPEKDTLSFLKKGINWI